MCSTTTQRFGPILPCTPVHTAASDCCEHSQQRHQNQNKTPPVVRLGGSAGGGSNGRQFSLATKPDCFPGVPQHTHVSPSRARRDERQTSVASPASPLLSSCTALPSPSSSCSSEAEALSLSSKPYRGDGTRIRVETAALWPCCGCVSTSVLNRPTRLLFFPLCR